MTPYLEHPSGVLYCADALTVLRDLPDKVIDLCVTSPPYYNHLAKDRHPDVLGLEPHPDVYLFKLEQVFAEVRRVLKPEGVMWLVMDDWGVKALEDVLNGMCGWFPCRRMRSPHDGIIQIFTIQPRYWKDLNKLKTWGYRKEKSQVFIPNPVTGQGVGFFPPFSRDIPRQAIKHCCPPDGTVLDPFVGQGTTILEAIRATRKFIGIDISQKLCEYIGKELLNGPSKVQAEQAKPTV